MPKMHLVTFAILSLALHFDAHCQSHLSLGEILDSPKSVGPASVSDDKNSEEADVVISPAVNDGYRRSTLDLSDLEKVVPSRTRFANPILDAGPTPMSSLSEMLQSDEISVGRKEAACAGKFDNAQIILSILEELAADACKSETELLRAKSRGIDTVSSANSAIKASASAKKCASTLTRNVTAATELFPLSPDFECHEYNRSAIRAKTLASALSDHSEELSSAANSVRSHAQSVTAQIEKRNSDNSNKIIALGFAALAAGSASDIVGSDKALEMFSATAQDILTDGRAGALNQFKNSLNHEFVGARQTSDGDTSARGDNDASSGLVVDEMYTYSCEMTGEKSIRIQAKSHACASAMKSYAKTAGCNEIDEMQVAEKEYYSACASEMYE